ncbi:tyrosine-type recombinase/integrase [Actinoplanes sp. NPDC020271]|uniref:tyrosine-type recombinase/integrase n=1 Tax=Actinoplanes sp. NPDC020271 TaxID=3363896 RepID=UPI003793549D
MIASDGTVRRIQMSRQHPWRTEHPDAVIVDRSTRWGNPYNVDELGRAEAVDRFQQALLAGELPGIGEHPPVTVTDVRAELAGQTLACWCAPGAECHADVLAAVAAGELGPPRRGRAPAVLPPRLQIVHAGYVTALGKATMLDEDTRRAYASRVRTYLAWLDGADVDGDPLTDPAARDGAVRDYKSHLQTVLKRKPATINGALAAIGDFYLRCGLGVPSATRLDLPPRAPRALNERDSKRWLRAVERRENLRDQLIGLLPFYAGVRIGEEVALDVDDVQISARKGLIIVRSGKGGRYREVPVHPALRGPLVRYLTEVRPGLPGTADSKALLLNHRGARLSYRGAHDILKAIAEDAGIPDDVFDGGHTLRHTFGTRLVREGHDLVLVAELMGHARLDTTRLYSLPTDED